ncbi:MAG TPA: hypothetical protein VLE43_11410 [Candidatus Saccharimonadia bacterium]|nr:hypothetical protein [Candidatus Saccharimonadia bacterium]
MPDTPEVIAARKQAAQFNANIRTGLGITAPTTPQASLDTVLGANTSTVKYSDSGAGGAILVLPGPDLPTGAAIKVESESSVKTAEKCSQVMEHFFANATGSAPFAAPRIQVYRAGDFATDPNLQPQLAGKFNSLQNDANVQGRWGFEQAKASVGKVANGETAVVVMEFAQGQQLNKLPTEEKAALVRSEAFAQTMGRAMAPSMALGLTDHGGIHDMGSAHKANISNFMYSPKSGTLSVIDYDSGGTPLDPNNPGGAVRVGGPDTADNLKKMRTFLEQAAQSPADFEKAVDAMCTPNTNTPFSAMMESFSKHSYDGMFGRSGNNGNAQDQEALKSFSMDDKKQFAANLLIGAADGLDYLQQNQQALENAVNNTHEVDANGQTVEHFYTQQEMADLKQELGQGNAQNLKTSLTQHLDARSLKESNDLATYVGGLDKNIQNAQQRLDAAEAKIDHLRNHPTTGERLKSAFSTKGNSPLTKASDERESALRELRTARDLKAMATDRLEHLDNMRVQSKIPPVPQLPPPPLPGNTNVNTTTTTTTTTLADSTNVGLGNGGQQQVAPQKPHVRDILHMSDHRQSAGEGLGEKTGEKAPKLKEGPGHHPLGKDHPEFAEHLNQSRHQTQDKTLGPNIKT